LWALLFRDTFAFGIANMTLFASASSFADQHWADWVFFVAATIATFALTEFFVFTALFWFNVWWNVAGWVGEHLHVVQFHFWALFFQDAFSIGIANTASFAGTSLDADAWANFGWSSACIITAFALTEFFIGISAHFNFRNVAGWVGEHFQVLLFSGWSITFVSWHANVIFVSQIAGFAEASNNALLSADWTSVWFGAGWSAC